MIDKWSLYRMALQVITVCAEEYRYNFLIDCEGYRDSVQIANELLKELLAFNVTVIKSRGTKIIIVNSLFLLINQ